MKPRILLVPTLTELEWAVRPLLEEWADVISYDGPGVGDAPPLRGPRSIATAERGLERIDAAGWDRCIVVGDELGSIAAVMLAHRRPRAVSALVLGHPLLTLSFTGDSPSVNAAVMQAHMHLAGTSFRAFVREQFRAWAGLYGVPAADADELADHYVARVPHGMATSFHREVVENATSYEALLREALPTLADVPLLLVAHEGCLMYTREGFEQAFEALPHAETGSTRQKPSVDPEFAGVLREFIERHGG